jgi:hypothetical protein
VTGSHFPNPGPCTGPNFKTEKTISKTAASKPREIKLHPTPREIGVGLEPLVAAPTIVGGSLRSLQCGARTRSANPCRSPATKKSPLPITGARRIAAGSPGERNGHTVAASGLSPRLQSSRNSASFKMLRGRLNPNNICHYETSHTPFAYAANQPV